MVFNFQGIYIYVHMHIHIHIYYTYRSEKIIFKKRPSFFCSNKKIRGKTLVILRPPWTVDPGSLRHLALSEVWCGRQKGSGRIQEISLVFSERLGEISWFINMYLYNIDKYRGLFSFSIQNVLICRVVNKPSLNFWSVGEYVDAISHKLQVVVTGMTTLHKQLSLPPENRPNMPKNISSSNRPRWWFRIFF